MEKRWKCNIHHCRTQYQKWMSRYRDFRKKITSIVANSPTERNDPVTPTKKSKLVSCAKPIYTTHIRSVKLALFLFNISGTERLVERLRTLLLVPDGKLATVLPTAHHQCVSSELCSPGAKPRNGSPHSLHTAA